MTLAMWRAELLDKLDDLHEWAFQKFFPVHHRLIKALNYHKDTVEARLAQCERALRVSKADLTRAHAVNSALLDTRHFPRWGINNPPKEITR